ncbi:ABC transporter ATP-binding protein [Nitratireductor pacificus]|uniref:Oligopeptide ABC transporter ATP-binding protein n=1 Tax=Nitratireductor pacificus pht-3B TaxID=391937 RepID=K2MDI8_9HYPH|nr:ABC transporter ATP-binding protein [Nitratireductor pacificus]EKF18855.1 oligopeptide ABC transporter ATP-binding protein [Nitratireductor pacificus pht-3B]
MASGANTLLDIRDLSVSFAGLRGSVTVLHDIAFSVKPGEIVGIVGESGSGKSVTSLAIMGLLGAQGSIESGSIRFGDEVLTELSPARMREKRGRDMAMIFQEPGTSLNPILQVGFQIAEVLVEHTGADLQSAQRRAIELMAQVGIPAPEKRARDYPHQLSGGMKQRIMIAMALACRPKLLIADEPTTALDVTIQAQILKLIVDLRDELDMAVLLITHDMGVVAETADRVVVMYAGQIVEQSTAERLFTRPTHPYTKLLLRSIPSAHEKQEVLPVIEGTTPSPSDHQPGCRFAPRCPIAADMCRDPSLSLVAVAPDHAVRCCRLDAARELDVTRAVEAGL